MPFYRHPAADTILVPMGKQWMAGKFVAKVGFREERDGDRQMHKIDAFMLVARPEIRELAGLIAVSRRSAVTAH